MPSHVLLLALAAFPSFLSCLSLLFKELKEVVLMSPCPFLHTQIELAILRFPYDAWGTPFQQLKQVVEEPSPQLPANAFSAEFVDFTSQW